MVRFPFIRAKWDQVRKSYLIFTVLKQYIYLEYRHFSLDPLNLVFVFKLYRLMLQLYMHWSWQVNVMANNNVLRSVCLSN